MTKPNIPSIENEEMVIDWFLKYDERIDKFLQEPSNFEKIKNEIIENLKDNPDANSLRSFIQNVWDTYRMTLRHISEKKATNEGVEKDIFIMEIVLSAKMRILGYFLLKKYNIQLDF